MNKSTKGVKVIELLWAWVKYHEDTTGAYPRPFTFSSYLLWCDKKNPFRKLL